MGRTKEAREILAKLSGEERPLGPRQGPSPVLTITGGAKLSIGQILSSQWRGLVFVGMAIAAFPPVSTASSSTLTLYIRRRPAQSVALARTLLVPHSRSSALSGIMLVDRVGKWRMLIYGGTLIFVSLKSWRRSSGHPHVDGKPDVADPRPGIPWRSQRCARSVVYSRRGSIFSIVMGEMFPNSIRGGAMSLASGADFLVNFLWSSSSSPSSSAGRLVPTGSTARSASSRSSQRSSSPRPAAPSLKTWTGRAPRSERLPFDFNDERHCNDNLTQSIPDNVRNVPGHHVHWHRTDTIGCLEQPHAQTPVSTRWANRLRLHTASPHGDLHAGSRPADRRRPGRSTRCSPTPVEHRLPGLDPRGHVDVHAGCATPATTSASSASTTAYNLPTVPARTTTHTGAPKTRSPTRSMLARGHLSASRRCGTRPGATAAGGRDGHIIAAPRPAREATFRRRFWTARSRSSRSIWLEGLEAALPRRYFFGPHLLHFLPDGGSASSIQTTSSRRKTGGLLIGEAPDPGERDLLVRPSSQTSSGNSSRSGASTAMIDFEIGRIMDVARERRHPGRHGEFFFCCADHGEFWVHTASTTRADDTTACNVPFIAHIPASQPMGRWMRSSPSSICRPRSSTSQAWTPRSWRTAARSMDLTCSRTGRRLARGHRVRVHGHPPAAHAAHAGLQARHQPRVDPTNSTTCAWDRRR